MQAQLGTSNSALSLCLSLSKKLTFDTRGSHGVTTGGFGSHGNTEMSIFLVNTAGSWWILHYHCWRVIFHGALCQAREAVSRYGTTWMSQEVSKWLVNGL